MPGLTDEKSALIAMNHAMQKVTEEMGRLAVGVNKVNHAMDREFTEQFAQFHWALNAMFDTMPYQPNGRRSGGIGGPYFDGSSGSSASSSTAASKASAKAKSNPASNLQLATRVLDPLGRGKSFDPTTTPFMKWLDRASTGLKKFAEWTEKDSTHQFAKSALQHGGMALQAGAPDSFATLTGSMKLLYAVLGKELVPYTAVASKGLQNVAFWFDNLGKKGKAWTGLGSALTIAAAGAFVMLPQLMAAGKLLYSIAKPAAGMGMRAMQGLGMFAGAHPGVAVAGGALVAGGIAGASMDARIRNTNIMADQISHAREAAINARPEDAIKQDPEYRRVQAMSPENRQAYFRTQRREALGDLKQANAREKEERGNDFFANLGLNEIFNRGGIVEARGQREKAQGRLDRLNEMQRVAEGRYKQSPEAKAARDNQFIQAHGLLQSIQSNNQPGYYGVEDMYKKIQLSALQENPLDQEIRRIQNESLEELMKSNGTLKEILQKLGFGAGLGQ